LKLSGEALASAASDETIDASTVDFLAREIASAMERGGLELAVVVGGGNIWRGATGAMAGDEPSELGPHGNARHRH
jgi:uridylate kinase